MKKILAICLLLFAFGSMFAQETSIAPKQKKNFALPKSFFNLDVNYNIPVYSSAFMPILAKAMIGSNNTGIILTYQKMSIITTFIDTTIVSKSTGYILGLGYQKSIVRGLYANVLVNFGRRKLSEDNQSLLSWRLNTGLGYTISLGKSKRIYLSTEMIFSPINFVFDESFSDQARFRIMGGIGFRFGTPAKTTYDGIKQITTVPVKL